MSHRDNVTRIKAVFFALEELTAEVVFVGGATVSLYSTRLLNQKYIDEWISVHLEYIEQKRVNLILGSMAEFVEEYK